jgi:PKHD-type hydroxylase
MMLRIPAVLDRDQLDTIKHILAEARFVDGKLSAGTEARQVKNNQELDGSSRQFQVLNNLVMGNLVRHPTYLNGALPQRIAVPFYARYQPEMSYGDHVDDPIMGPVGSRYRSDIAITVFLSDPKAYEGGELVVQTAFGANTVKLPAGDAIMYPASSLHHVAEVTRGERLVAVTWVQSLVRDPARRELLYELGQARDTLLKTAPTAPETARISTVYVNLVRMWSEL